MYRDAGQWEDSFRVVRDKGSAKEAAALALEWALSVGPEVGGKILSRYGMAEECIALASDQEMVYFLSLKLCRPPLQFVSIFQSLILPSVWPKWQLRTSSKLSSASWPSTCKLLTVGKKLRRHTSRYSFYSKRLGQVLIIFD